MKTKYIYFAFAFLLFATTLFAQSPSLINYQAVLRDANGNALSGGPVNLTFKVYAGSASVAAWRLQAAHIEMAKPNQPPTQQFELVHHNLRKNDSHRD